MGSSEDVALVVPVHPGWTTYDATNSNIPEGAPIWSMAIDHDGNLWAGTSWNGLLRFDGADWTHLTRSNSELPHDSVGDIEVDVQGNIWLATDGGIACYNNRTGWVAVYDTSTSNIHTMEFFSVAVDSAGIVWAGSNVDGLAKFSGVTWTAFTRKNSGLQFSRIYDLAVDEQDRLWMACDGGAQMFDGTDWFTWDGSNSPVPSSDIVGVDINRNGHVWLSSDGGPHLEHDGKNWIAHQSPYIVNGRLAIDGEDIVWVGGSGLVRYDDTNWTMYDSTNSGLPDARVHAIAVDQDGTKWVGTLGAGIARFQELD